MGIEKAYKRYYNLVGKLDRTKNILVRKYLAYRIRRNVNKIDSEINYDFTTVENEELWSFLKGNNYENRRSTLFT